MRHIFTIAALGLASMAFQAQAQAALITQPSQLPAPAQVIDFNAEDGLFIGIGSSYSANLPPVTLSSQDGDFTVGQRIATDLGINGSWGAGKSFLSFDKIGDMTLRIDFNGLKTRAFLADWSMYEEANDNRLTTVTAYGIDGSSESFSLGSFATSLDGVDLDDSQLIYSTNFSVTQGIRLAHADIAYITIHGDGVVMDNFAYTQAVPEPESIVLAALGLGAVVLLRRRRQA